MKHFCKLIIAKTNAKEIPKMFVKKLERLKTNKKCLHNNK